MEENEGDGYLWEESGWDGLWEIFNTPSFYSSDDSVAVVDNAGLVRAVGVGTAEITARYNGREACQTRIFAVLPFHLTGKKFCIYKVNLRLLSVRHRNIRGS